MGHTRQRKASVAAGPDVGVQASIRLRLIQDLILRTFIVAKMLKVCAVDGLRIFKAHFIFLFPSAVFRDHDVSLRCSEVMIFRRVKEAFARSVLIKESGARRDVESRIQVCAVGIFTHQERNAVVANQRIARNKSRGLRGQPNTVYTNYVAFGIGCLFANARGRNEGCKQQT